MKKAFEYAFLAVLVIHLGTHLFGWTGLHAPTKSLLMPLLAVWFYLRAKHPWQAGERWMAAGLLLSWIGDVLLIKGNEPLFFMTGLGSFLLAQLSYAQGFAKMPGNQPGLLRQNPFWALPILVVAVGMLWWLFPVLGDLKLPVTIYVGAISLMVLSALHFGNQQPGRLWLVLGASCFMLSDALLAINKFAAPIPLAGFWIMLTYGIAQYGLVRGFTEKV